MSKILGLNSAGYNTASALVVDGAAVFATEEERIIRQKRTRMFPMHGIRAALKHAGLRLEDIDAIGIGWNPAVNLEAFGGGQSSSARYLGEIFYNVPNHLMALKPNNHAALSRQTIDFIDGSSTEIVYVTHHLAHASSFFFSPFEEAAILTADAFGEKQCATFSSGAGNRIESLWDQEFPHALGSFFALFTEYCGFRPQNDEWKLMGAAAFGDRRRFLPKLRELVSLHDDGGFALDLRHFNHYQFHRPHMYTPLLIEHLGFPPNEQEKPLTELYYDLAAAAQAMFEEIYFHLMRALHKRTGLKNLVLAGGTALNSLANGKVREQTPFEELFIPPVPDDSGCSVGAAFYIHHMLNDAPRDYVMRTNYLGPRFSDDEIIAELTRYKAAFEIIDDRAARAAGLIAAGNIIGWFQGAMEFGDRALGNRSILGDPRDPALKDKVNESVKYREPFRPFAPSTLEEHAADYFVDPTPAPFMEKVFPIRPDKRDTIPAVVHADGTGRLQTVSREQNLLFYELIEHFHTLTGVPAVLNTSFNVKGEPIVCTPSDALRTFHTSGLDALIIGPCLLTKGS